MSTAETIQSRFGDSVLKVKQFRGETYVCLATQALRDVVTFLKEDADLAFNYFVECVGVDYSTWTHERDLPGRFEVVYNLYSVDRAERLFLKVSTDDGVPIPTLKDIFLGAEYPEREIQDLYGVVFLGNEAKPGERFLLPDDWVGFPLRKEYPLGGEDVVFDASTHGPAIEDMPVPMADSSFTGKTGTEEISGR